MANGKSYNIYVRNRIAILTSNEKFITKRGDIDGDNSRNDVYFKKCVQKQNAKFKDYYTINPYKTRDGFEGYDDINEFELQPHMGCEDDIPVKEQYIFLGQDKNTNYIKAIINRIRFVQENLVYNNYSSLNIKKDINDPGNVTLKDAIIIMYVVVSHHLT